MRLIIGQPLPNNGNACIFLVKVVKVPYYTGEHNNITDKNNIIVC